MQIENFNFHIIFFKDALHNEITSNTKLWFFTKLQYAIHAMMIRENKTNADGHFRKDDRNLTPYGNMANHKINLANRGPY